MDGFFFCLGVEQNLFVNPKWMDFSFPWVKRDICEVGVDFFLVCVIFFCIWICYILGE